MAIGIIVSKDTVQADIDLGKSLSELATEIKESSEHYAYVANGNLPELTQVLDTRNISFTIRAYEMITAHHRIIIARGGLTGRRPLIC
jgi:hypothetical protein